MKSSRILISLLMAGSMVSFARADSMADKTAEKSIEQSYTYHSVLQGNVKVSVDNGVAKLTGKVSDTNQKKLAEDTASGTSGVTSIDSRIKVDPDTKERSDDWIKFKAKTELLVRANVSSTNTKIDVVDGVVMLSGTAESTAQKELTEAYVKDIDGVKSVKNNLTVVTPAERKSMSDTAADKIDNTTDKMRVSTNRVGDKIDDASITAQVKYALLSHKSTSAVKTSVNTIDGNVIVSGEAASDAEKDLVTTLAKSVRGVQSVDNNMTVRK